MVDLVRASPKGGSEMMFERFERAFLFCIGLVYVGCGAGAPSEPQQPGLALPQPNHGDETSQLQLQLRSGESEFETSVDGEDPIKRRTFGRRIDQALMSCDGGWMACVKTCFPGYPYTGTCFRACMSEAGGHAPAVCMSICRGDKTDCEQECNDLCRG